MRIGSIDYSSKATKLIAALMVFVLIFTFVVPTQEADAAAGVALAAGLTLAFVAACGVAFTVNEAQNSSTYWEGQIDSYLSDSGFSDVQDWVDFGAVVYDSASGTLRYPGALIRSLLNFFDWFTSRNEITAGGSVLMELQEYYYNGLPVYIVGDYECCDLKSIPVGSEFYLGSYPVSLIKLYTKSSGTEYYYKFSISGVSYSDTFTCGGSVISSSGFCLVSSVINPNSNNSLFLGVWHKLEDSTIVRRFTDTSLYGTCFVDSILVNYTSTGGEVLGMPDIGEKEQKLGYVPDINIPLPETVVEDTNIGDINDAATAVLDYAGTAGNTLDLEYEYVEDTNVDTGTDTETGEGTQEGTGTDAETGTQTGSVALENVAADSLVEVAPETMLNDDTLLGLFISKFPWCIPFDLYFAISAFAADPVAPEFEVNLFEGVSWEGLDLSGTEMTLSFEAFEKVAAVTRWSTLIVFCAGLAMITKRMIWS